MDPRLAFAGVAGAVAAAVAGRVLYAGWKRYPTAEHLPLEAFKKHAVIRGRVTSVGDGDDFRMYHHPWLRRLLARVPKKLNRDNTIHVRLAGVDAPECAHFGKPGQPYGPEALAFLRGLITDRRVTVQLMARDQYQRAVAMVWYRNAFFVRRNVSAELLKAGYATLYTAGGAQYGGHRAWFERLEAHARRRRVGMWAGDIAAWVSPAEYKRTAVAVSAGGSGGAASALSPPPSDGSISSSSGGGGSSSAAKKAAATAAAATAAGAAAGAAAGGKRRSFATRSAGGSGSGGSGDADLSARAGGVHQRRPRRSQPTMPAASGAADAGRPAVPDRGDSSASDDAPADQLLAQL